MRIDAQAGVVCEATGFTQLCQGVARALERPAKNRRRRDEHHWLRQEKDGDCEDGKTRECRWVHMTRCEEIASFV